MCVCMHSNPGTLPVRIAGAKPGSASFQAHIQEPEWLTGLRGFAVQHTPGLPRLGGGRGREGRAVLWQSAGHRTTPPYHSQRRKKEGKKETKDKHSRTRHTRRFNNGSGGVVLYPPVLASNIVQPPPQQTRCCVCPELPLHVPEGVSLSQSA